MVSSVTLGNFFNVGGRSVSGGTGGSGLDTEALLNALVDARKIPVTQLQSKVTLNDKKVTALTDYKTLLSKFKDAADLLRSVPGLGKESSNAFDYASASIASNTSVAGSSYLSVTAAPGARAQSYTINEIEQLAQAKVQVTDPFAIADADTAVVDSTPDPGQFGAGTLTINGQNIVLASGDSLNTVSSKFNSVSTLTGIYTTVVKVADNSFQLLFSATTTGEDADFDLNSAGTVTSGIALLSQLTIDDKQDAKNAKFTLNGIDIQRQGNSIDDVIEGLTFNLQQATPALTTLTATVSHDTTTAKNAIVGFINAYNDIKIFAAKQSQLKDDGTYADDSVLANNPTLRSSVNTMLNEISNVVGGISGTNYSRLSDLGISFTDLQQTDDNPFVRNVLTLDDTKLESALSSNFDQVRKVFEFQMTSNNANLAAFTRTNALNVNSFSLTITPNLVTPSSSVFQATYTDGTGSHTINLTGTAFADDSGYTLEGQDGTVLEGLTLLYASTDAATISVSTTQGIADRLYNLSDSMLTSTTGILSVEIDAVKTNTEKLNDDIDKLNLQIDSYREQLLEKFSRLEQAISQVNTLLQSLDAQAQARANQ